MSREDVEVALVELAMDFESAGEGATWTGKQVAEVLRKRAIDRHAMLTNRKPKDETK
jgi:hypothetical protein